MVDFIGYVTPIVTVSPSQKSFVIIKDNDKYDIYIIKDKDFRYRNIYKGNMSKFKTIHKNDKIYLEIYKAFNSIKIKYNLIDSEVYNKEEELNGFYYIENNKELKNIYSNEHLNEIYKYISIKYLLSISDKLIK